MVKKIYLLSGTLYFDQLVNTKSWILQLEKRNVRGVARTTFLVNREVIGKGKNSGGCLL